MSALLDSHRCVERVNGALVVDCGAGVGEFALPALEAGAARVVCIDHDPECAETLRGVGLETLQVTLGDREGEWSLADVLDYCGWHIDVLKCDIEGSEYPFLIDASDTALTAVDFVTVEYHVWTVAGEPRRRGVGERTSGPSYPQLAAQQLLAALSHTHAMDYDGDLDEGGTMWGERR